MRTCQLEQRNALAYLTAAVAAIAVGPDLVFVSLCDGAPELRTLLRTALDEAVLGTKVYELLDFWHLIEKLGPAAEVLYGAAGAKEVLARWRVDLLYRNAAPDEIFTEPSPVSLAPNARSAHAPSSPYLRRSGKSGADKAQRLQVTDRSPLPGWTQFVTVFHEMQC